MTRVISLSDEAYEALQRLKGPGESLSDVILRLVGGSKPRPLTSFAGRWAGEDAEQVLRQVLAGREGASREFTL